MPSYALIRPLLHLLSPESAHGVAIWALKSGLAGRARASDKADDALLATRVWHLSFPNPIGLAAGFDKDAEVMDAMLAFGFGFVEAGSVTPLPQPGNPKPRLFRLDEDQAVINRFGFNSKGLEHFAARLRERKQSGGAGIVGANVGKNRDAPDAAADYATGIAAVCGLADYLVCNVSSPNTPGLRTLQFGEQLDALLGPIRARSQSLDDALGRKVPLLVKIAPDMNAEEVALVAGSISRNGLDGVIATNTTISREAVTGLTHAEEAGGLSGQPVREGSTRVIRALRGLLGDAVPIIGVGGILAGEHAREKIDAGAQLVQLYTGLIYRGPSLVAECARALAR